MAKTDVVWQSYHVPEAINRGYWDQSILEDMLKGDDFRHHNGVDRVKDGAIFIINGRMHVEDAAAINADIAKLRWVLFIITGDEEATFPWREIKHPIMRVWVQLPRMNEHNDTSMKLPNGPRPGSREQLRKIGPQEKKYDWSFIGQVNHPRREQCVEAAKELPNGIVVPTAGFGDEKLNQAAYMEVMAQTKIVLCPSGIECPDTFRLYEALEAGCLPVVDAFSTKHQAPGFWSYLFGEDIPFPIVDYWDKLPALLPELLKGYPHNANRAAAWWQNKKREIYYRLIDDVKELSK